MTALFLTVPAVGPDGTAHADEYRLGPQDRLRIRVVEWREIEGAFGDWSSVSGEYVVAADGSVSFPLLGAVQAEGLTESEFARAVTASLRAQVSVTTPPSVSVEVVEFRPVYVTGDVQSPAAYPFVPGLTTVQALALAGGAWRGNLDDENVQATAIRNAGSMEEAKIDLARFRARADRLEAEIAGAEEIEFGADLEHPAGPAATAEIKAEERRIFATRREALERERTALADLIELLRAEIAALEIKLENQREQIELVREAVGDMRSLLERGLARSPTMLNLQSTLINLEAAELDLETGISRARQRIAEAQRDDLQLLTGRETEAALELQRTRSEIERLRAHQQTLALLLAEAGADLAEDEVEIVLDYQILRQQQGETITIAAEEQTPLRPLDVLRVTRRVLDGSAPGGGAVGVVSRGANLSADAGQMPGASGSPVAGVPVDVVAGSTIDPDEEPATAGRESLATPERAGATEAQEPRPAAPTVGPSEAGTGSAAGTGSEVETASAAGSSPASESSPAPENSPTLGDASAVGAPEPGEASVTDPASQAGSRAESETDPVPDRGTGEGSAAAPPAEAEPEAQAEPETPAESESVEVSATAAPSQSPAAGCAERLGDILRDDPISFAQSASEPSSESAEVLDRLAAVLESCGSLRVTVGGHTDNIGAAEVNRQISRARAQSVAEALAARGVEAERLEAVGYGPSRPVADNGTASGRAANRRITLEVEPGDSSES